MPIVPVSTLFDDGQPERPCAAITFDDAYHGAVTLGLHACAEAGAPATVFISPALLGQVPHWDVRAGLGSWTALDRKAFLEDDRGIASPSLPGTVPQGALMRIANFEELRLIAVKENVSFGNHTFHHANLQALDLAEAVAEVRSTQEWLDMNFSEASVPFLAYPYGLAPDFAEALAASTRIRGAFRVEGGWLNRKRLVARASLPRWNVPSSINEDSFRLRLNGYLCQR
ncbi:MAG: polysaccharide deacetylase family protein [Gemmatimonadaceae bacterium]|nr:polysaccharide deacetylase family protein [Gemmatimonadaceae bacterium]